MSEGVLLGLVAAAAVLNLLVLLWLALRQGGRAEQGAAQSMERQVERLERELRDELGRQAQARLAVRGDHHIEVLFEDDPDRLPRPLLVVHDQKDRLRFCRGRRGREVRR